MQAPRRTLVRTFLLLAATGLGACVADPGGYGYGYGYGRPPPAGVARLPARPEPGRRVAILLPLTGANAELGQSMLRAAQLVLDGPDAPALDARDTGGTPDGAAAAARGALEGGARLILGPLTNAETAAVATVARAAGVPVLAFTSDASQAQQGVWTLGITPGQQARRLVQAVQADNRTRLAAVVPQNPFGEALATGFVSSATSAGLPEPRVLRYSNGFTGLNAALKDVSGYNARRGAIEEQQRLARARSDADGRREAAELGKQDVPPSPVDALLLGAAGEQLGQAVPLLSFYDIGPDQVRILGPAIWAREAPRLAALSGAWYAAPDPALRAPFERNYAARHNAPPRELASLAYDAAGIARVVADQSGFPLNSLMRPEGFVGADGPLALQPDGSVRRGLAVFEIGPGGSRAVQPTPSSMMAPGT